MKLRADLNYLLNKYRLQVAAWRNGAMKASWEQITRELCMIEKVAESHRPTGEGMRRAWVRLQRIQTSPTVATLQTNNPASHVGIDSSGSNITPTLQALQTLATVQTVQTNRPEGLAVVESKKTPRVFPERVSERTQRARTALFNGNVSDEEAGIA